MSRDMVARTVFLVASAGHCVNLPEKTGVERGYRAQRLQVAGARGLEVGEPTSLADEGWVDVNLSEPE